MKYSKEQLEAMSDYQLSCKVLSKKSGCEIMTQTLQLPHSACLGRDDNNMVLMFDVNNPSDMMPLSNENFISLQYHLGSKVLAYGFADGVDYRIECFHSNYLRAAAIVYILIKQGE